MRLAATLASLGALSLVACGDGGECPTLSSIGPGTYVQEGGHFTDTVTPPYETITIQKEMQIDYQAGTVTVSYLQGPKRIVERYWIRSYRGPMPKGYVERPKPEVDAAPISDAGNVSDVGKADDVSDADAGGDAPSDGVDGNGD